MLIADETRRRCTFVPVGLLVIGLLLGALTVGLLLTASLREAWLPGALALLGHGWFAFGVRHARRDGEEIEVRSLATRQRVPATGSEVVLQQGGGHRSPHIDVLLQPAGRAALRLARLETLGIGRAPRIARRCAAVLDLPVHERSVGALEAQLDAAAEQRRKGWQWLAAILGVGTVASAVMAIVTAGTMATVVIRCPGGQVREGGATMLDGLEMTADPGTHAYELRPPDGPPWKQRVVLVAGQTTVIDCRARPEPSNDVKRAAEPDGTPRKAAN